MKYRLVLAAAALLAAAPLAGRAFAGDGCCPTCCDPCSQIPCGPERCCEKIECRPVPKVVKTDKTCYRLSFRYICLPHCQCPLAGALSKCGGAGCGCASGCATGCADCAPPGCADCAPPVCAEGYAVHRLRKFKVTTEKCGCDWEAVPVPCSGCGGCGCGETGMPVEGAAPAPAAKPEGQPKPPVPPSARLPQRGVGSVR